MGAQFIPRLLAQLKDVLVTSPTNNQVLTYETSSGLWKNKTAPGGGGGTVTSVTALDASIVVSGTAADPILRAGSVDTLATLHAMQGPVNMNSQRIVNMSDPSLAADAATRGWVIAHHMASLTRTAVKTSAYTAAAGDLVPVDTSSGAVTVTLPDTPDDKTVVAVKHIIQGGTNAVTVARNSGGSDVFNKAGGGTSVTLPLLNQGVLLVYDGPTLVWTVVADDLSLSQLDLRFQPLDSDLTAIAALSTTSYGRAVLALADAAALRTAGGLVIGTDVEAHDSDLTTIGGLSPTNDDVMQRKAGAWANRTIAQLLTDLAAAGTTFQPLDSDLTSIAALSTTSFGRSLLAAADAAALRTLAGAVIGTNVQAWDADLDAIAALSSAADKLPYATGAQAWALTTLSSFVRTLLDDADAATARTTLGLGSLATASTIASADITDGTIVNADINASAAIAYSKLNLASSIVAADLSDVELSSIAGLTSAANKLPYFTGSGTAALADLSAFGRTFIDDADAATVRTTLGLVIGTNVQAWDTDLDTWATKTAPSGAAVGTTDTQTLTNKRVTKRTGTTTSSATPTINTDNVDFYSLTAQTVDITSFTTNLSGTPTEGQMLWIAITGTAARAIAWGTSFEDSTVARPATTVTTARLDVGFVWNTVTSKWRCVASS